MFDFTTNYTFKWPVVVKLPQLDGTFKEQTFEAVWKAQDSNEVAKAQAAHPKGAMYALLEMALESTVGLNDGGSEMAINPANLDRIVGATPYAMGLCASYWDAMNGRLREKN